MRSCRDYEKDLLEKVIKEQSHCLTDNYLDSFLECILTVKYTSSNILGISYESGKHVVRHKMYNYLYYIDEIKKEITMLGFKLDNNIPDEKTVKDAFRKFSFLQNNIFHDFKEIVFVSEFEIYEINRLLEQFSQSNIPFDAGVDKKSYFRKTINNNFSSLDNLIIGEEIYDFRRLKFCESHDKIFQFDFVDSTICGMYEKCLACEWISSRELPFHKCLLEGKKDHIGKFSKQDLQSIILFFHNITTEIPDVIFDIANLIFYS